jgi:hypothetical protein
MSEISRLYPLDGQALEPLWREVLGSRLRELRTERDETLAQTAERAGISPQYLSEVDITVADLMAGAAEYLRRAATVVVSGTMIGTAATVTRPAGQRPSGPVALAMAA